MIEARGRSLKIDGAWAYVYYPMRRSWMAPRKKRRIRRVVFWVFVALAVSLCPLPIRDVDRARAVEKAYAALLDGRRVLGLHGYAPLPGRERIAEATTRYFVNDTFIDDEVFLRLGLKRLRDETWEPVVDIYENGSVLIMVAFRDPDENTVSTDFHFNYHFGNLGAHGMKLALYRNVFGVFVFYWFEWVA